MEHFDNSAVVGQGSVAVAPATSGSQLTRDDLDLARLSEHSYKDECNELPEGYEIIGILPIDQKSGYSGTAYRNTKTGEIIIAHRGSEFDEKHAVWKDIKADVTLAAGLNPKQLKDALDFVKKIAKDNNIDPKSIRNTGHSLGGFLSEEVALRLGSSSVSFDSPQSPLMDLAERINLLKKKGANIRIIINSPNGINSGIGLISPAGRVVTPVKLPGILPSVIESHFLENIIKKMEKELEKGERKYANPNVDLPQNILLAPSENVKSSAKSFNEICLPK